MSGAKSIVFPYGIRLRDGGRMDIFPVAEVKFPRKEGDWISLFLVIDSGATLSAMPKSDAQVLGLHPEDGSPISISGIGPQPITGWMYNVKARIGNEMITFPVAFLENNFAPRVLGRAEIFGRFTVVFDETKQRSGLLGATTSEARRIQRILDRITR